MKNIKKAAIIALAIVIIKLCFRLIPPADRFFSLFELGIGYGLLIILITYVVLFMIVFIVLTVMEKRKTEE